MKTRLSSNLRQSTRECVYLVKCGYFRSRHKDGVQADPLSALDFTDIFYRTGAIADQSFTLLE